MLIRPAIGDTDPIRYRRPTPDGQFSGNIIDEAMRHPELYSDLLKGGLANCRVQLEIDRKKTPRLQQQNAYLWAAVYPVIAEHTGNSIPEIHEVCSRCFCRLAKCRSATGW
jgi:hypothetical protein